MGEGSEWVNEGICLSINDSRKPLESVTLSTRKLAKALLSMYIQLGQKGIHALNTFSANILMSALFGDQPKT